MRWADVEALDPHDPDLPWPSRAQMLQWTRAGLIRSRGGRFYDWPPREVEVAKLAARLIAAGLTTVTAFTVARADPDPGGVRVVVIGYHIAVHAS